MTAERPAEERLPDQETPPAYSTLRQDMDDLTKLRRHGMRNHLPPNAPIAIAASATIGNGPAPANERHVHAHPNTGAFLPDAHHTKVHTLADTAVHTASGLTTGFVLRASGATTYAWAQLQHADLGGVGADDHHNRAHALNAAGDHSATFTQGTIPYIGGTGLLTETSSLRFDSVGNRLSFGAYTGQKIDFYNSLAGAYAIGVESSELRFATNTGAKLTWFTGGYGGAQRMQLDSNGLGVGVAPLSGQSITLPAATGRKIGFYGDGLSDYHVGVEAGELRHSVPTGGKHSFVVGGYSGTERLKVDATAISSNYGGVQQDISHIEAKETAGLASIESVSWGRAFSAAPIVTAVVFGAAAATIVNVTARSTTAATAASYTTAGAGVGAVKLLIARETT